MKCINHNADAQSVCKYCGKGLCKDCATFTKNNRSVCSEFCENQLLRSERAFDMIIEKSERALKINAYVYYVMGSIFIIAGLVSVLLLKHLFLSIFLILFGIGSMLAGLKTMKISSSNGMLQKQGRSMAETQR